MNSYLTCLMYNSDRKFAFFLYAIACSIGACMLFGILHDQVTYSISEEYYTRFKFIQFGLTAEEEPLSIPHRIGVILVGIKASWWMGIPIGLLLAIFSLVFRRDRLFLYYHRALLMIFSLTLLFGFGGYLNWKFHSRHLPADWYLPENLLDEASFICVGTIHNFTYTGAEIGLFCASFYLWTQKQAKNGS